MDQDSKDDLSVAQLRAENEHLRNLVARLTISAGVVAEQQLTQHPEQHAALEESRMSAAAARRDGRKVRRDALDAEQRHSKQLATAKGDLAFSERLVAELRASEAARQEAERRQHTLNQELSHRLKNTLNMVLAIASQTLKDASDQAAVLAFRQRIIALSTGHDVLLQKSWMAAPFQEVARKVLGLHGDPSRFDLRGSPIHLRPSGVLSLSLLLHELATNASKYGALSTPEGHVELTWAVTGTNDTSTFMLVWQEAGGPPVQEPTRKGFGSRLIRAGFCGTGDTSLSYYPSGLRAEFRSPSGLVTEQ